MDNQNSSVYNIVYVSCALRITQKLLFLSHVDLELFEVM